MSCPRKSQVSLLLPVLECTPSMWSQSVQVTMLSTASFWVKSTSMDEYIYVWRNDDGGGIKSPP